MKFFSGIIAGIMLVASVQVSAGWLSGGIGGAVGASIATSGIEGKVDTINFKLEALTKALDNVKVCK